MQVAEVEGGRGAAAREIRERGDGRREQGGQAGKREREREEGKEKKGRRKERKKGKKKKKLRREKMVVGDD